MIQHTTLHIHVMLYTIYYLGGGSSFVSLVVLGMRSGGFCVAVSTFMCAEVVFELMRSSLWLILVV